MMLHPDSTLDEAFQYIDYLERELSEVRSECVVLAEQVEQQKFALEKLQIENEQLKAKGENRIGGGDQSDAE